MKYHCLAYGDEKDWNALTKSERETPLAQDKLLRRRNTPFVVRTLVRSLGAQAGREVGLAAQAFALLGTLVGIFTIAIGIGPRTVPDLVYHATIVGVLVWGLTVAAQTHSHASDQHA